MRKGAAVGYVRIAIEDISGEKIQQQRNEIIAYCDEHRLYLAGIFEDNGATGTNFRRRGWPDLEDFLIHANSSISYLVVADLDPIGRIFFKVDREISRLKDNYGIAILPVQREMELNSALLTGLKRKSVKGSYDLAEV